MTFPGDGKTVAAYIKDNDLFNDMVQTSGSGVTATVHCTDGDYSATWDYDSKSYSGSLFS